MQDKIPTIKERVLLIPEKKGITKQEFFRKIGMSYGNFTGKSKKTPLNSTAISNISSLYPDINLNWLINGEGGILRDTSQLKREKYLEVFNDRYAAEPAQSYRTGIPLVESHAVAGFGNNDFSIQVQDVKSYYKIPAFKHKKVDFMIEIDGSSMYPKYSSGDIVACTVLKERQFIQWNKVHVVATKEQGLIVKRIHKGENGSLKMVSDNANYPPFEVSEDQITGIALVVGVIRLE